MEAKVSVRPMTAADTPACAAIACASEIGRRYGFVPERLAELLARAIEKGDLLLAAEAEGRVAGFAWVDPRGAFSSAPYLRLIAVDESVRGAGVGSALMGEFERLTRDVGRDYCLLVSGFNAAAIAFYEGRGYRKRGELPDFARPGIAEILMVKPREGEAP